MKARELAELLLQHPDDEVVFDSDKGWYGVVWRVERGVFSPRWESFLEGMSVDDPLDSNGGYVAAVRVG